MKTPRSLWPAMMLSLALAVASGGCAHTTPKAPPLAQGQNRVLAKMREIVFPEVAFDGLPLNEVMQILSDDTKKFDPERRGLNFLFRTAPQAGFADDQWSYLNTTIIKVWPPLKNVRLSETLDIIARCAHKPIQFSIEDYGVSVSGRWFGARLPVWSSGSNSWQGKLDQIVFPEVMFDDLFLNDVVKIINDKAKRFDKEGQGVNILMTSLWPDALRRTSKDNIPPLVELAPNHPISSNNDGFDDLDRIDLDNVYVKTLSPYKNVSLRQVLDIVMRSAEWEIEYKVESYGVVIMQKFDKSNRPTPKTRP